jgi:CheY-like chemotaxis protein/HPt (histidine-containing phosphotransfer) domain-containing protein
MQKAEKEDLNGILIKPVNASVLLDTIMQAFGKGIPETSRIIKRQANADALQEIRGARILLVEDNDINQQVAREILEDAGLIVTLATNGRQAVEAAGKNVYDAILMDVQMPLMDGYSATREIRNFKSETRNVPIIAMTAHAMAGDEQKSRDAGMNDHISKPIEPDMLFTALQQWIRLSGKKSGDPRQDAFSRSLHQERSERTVEKLPEFLPGFDLEAGLNRLSGNLGLYRKLLRDFAAKYSDVTLDLRKALDADDLKTAHRLVHNVKGVAGNLSATDLQVAAKEIEKLIKGGHGRRPAVDQLNRRFARFERAFKQALDAVYAAAPAVEEKSFESMTGAPGAIPGVLEKSFAGRIREAVEMGDITQVKSIAEEMRAQSDTSGPLYDELIRLVKDFDFDSILKWVDALNG